MPFEPTRGDGILQVSGRDVRWLSTGWGGGFTDADAAYNVSVPDGWDRTDVDAYVRERRERSGISTPGPALLTGVDMKHLRGARDGPVVVYATAGVSNPAALPVDGVGDGISDAEESGEPPEDPPTGTVNLVVGTSRALDDGAVASLLGVAVEAKAATLLASTGFPGTTTDAVIVGTSTDGDPASFAGSATEVGAAARACVRDAVLASLQSRYADRKFPASVADAQYGTVTTMEAEVFEP